MPDDKKHFAIHPDDLAQCTYIKLTKDRVTGKERCEEMQLACTHRCLLSKIVSYARNGKPCTALNSWWRGYLGVKPRQVQYLLDDLQRSGYITIEGKTKARKLYPTEKTLQIWRGLNLKDNNAIDAVSCANNGKTNAVECTNEKSTSAVGCTNTNDLCSRVHSTYAVECTHISSNDNNSSGTYQTTHRRKRKTATPPTLQEVETYIKEKGLTIDARWFFEYNTEGGWKDKKGNPILNWKQKALQWDRHQNKAGDTQTTQGPIRLTQADIERRDAEQRKQIDDATARYRQKKLAEMQKGATTA